METSSENQTSEALPLMPPSAEAVPSLDTPITIREMMEAGVHFGHQTRRWNPKMKSFIFGARNGIHIIDLDQTARLFSRAFNFVTEMVAHGGHLLMIGTKRQAQESIQREAERCIRERDTGRRQARGQPGGSHLV